MELFINFLLGVSVLAKIISLNSMFAAVLFFFAAIGTAQADVYYTYIKLECDPSHQRAAVRVLDEPDSKLANPPANTYFLSDLSDSKQVVSCQITKNDLLTFSAYEGMTPNQSALRIYLNEKNLINPDLGYGPLVIYVWRDPKASSGYGLAMCVENPNPYPGFSGSPDEKQPGCPTKPQPNDFYKLP